MCHKPYFDTVLSVYKKTSQGVTRMSCNDDHCAVQSHITGLLLYAGVSYIFVSDLSSLESDSGGVFHGLLWYVYDCGGGSEK